MKRSRIFLGAAILLMSVAGAVAAKKADTTGVFYYYNAGYVHYVDGTIPCDLGGTGCLKAGTPYQVYKFTAPNTYTPLKKI